MCDRIHKRGKLTCKTADLSHSPGFDRSSPAWWREVLGVWGAPGGSRTTPGPAGKQESLLSASRQPVCTLISEVWDTEAQEGEQSFTVPLDSSKGDRALTSVLCALLTPTAKSKTNKKKEQSSASLCALTRWAADALKILYIRVFATSINQYMSWWYFIMYCVLCYIHVFVHDSNSNPLSASDFTMSASSVVIYSHSKGLYRHRIYRKPTSI